MQITELEKEKQLHTLLYTTKILAILFSVLPIFQYLFGGESISYMLENSKFTAMIVSLLVLIIILVLVCVITYGGKKHKEVFAILEMTLFFVLFFIAIFISGKNESYYKFLFVFVVVSSTIQFCLKVGVGIAILSSISLFTIDYIFTQSEGANTYIENDLALAAMFITLAAIIGLYSQLQKEHIDFLKFYANRDGLTKIYNHRYFYEKLEQDCKESAKNHKALSLLILDLDFFKIYNDIYGHQMGDDVLIKLVDIIKENLDEKAILSRYGGEEFSIILPETGLFEAVEYGEKIRQSVEDYKFIGEEALPDKTLTVSIGVAEFDNTSDYNDLVSRADSALYRAKHLKRNCVESFSNIVEQYFLKDIDENIGKLDKKMLKTYIGEINAKDNYTFNHMERVAGYCESFAVHLGLKEKDRKTLILAAFLHDLGKIKVDTEILITAKRLTDDQWNQLKTHPRESAKMVKEIGCNDEIVNIVEQHHERLDGTGYPNGLKSDQICYLARILTIADSFDAMTNNRPYNHKKSFEEGFSELIRCSHNQFDPQLVQQFIQSVKLSPQWREQEQKQ